MQICGSNAIERSVWCSLLALVLAKAVGAAWQGADTPVGGTEGVRVAEDGNRVSACEPRGVAHTLHAVGNLLLSSQLPTVPPGGIIPFATVDESLLLTPPTAFCRIISV